jgi:hypothetical protein
VTEVVLIPGVLALLPEYASLEDPVADLRLVILGAVSPLEGPVVVLADEQGRRVGEWALAAAGVSTRPAGAGQAAQSTHYLVVGNGSAKRSTEAPGYLDERAAGFDAALDSWLREGTSESLATVDRDLARELWASVEGIAAMGEVPGLAAAEVLYDDDPFGVQYWVMRWQCER